MMVEPGDARDAGCAIELQVDGAVVVVEKGASLLEACDVAGRYVPRLCAYPGVGRCVADGLTAAECGLCVVRVERGRSPEGPAPAEAGALVLACCAEANPGDRVCTDDPAVRSLRLERLALILDRHPHICLSCPDRSGCARNECTYGHPLEARCCDEFGRCELGRLIDFIDPGLVLPRRPLSVVRAVIIEGRIRREPALCIGCGRCVRFCRTSPPAGRALELAPVEPGRWAARPRADTLRESGCTYCGLCVMVCPAGALTAAGEAGASWLERRRAKHEPAAPVLPPVTARILIPDDLQSVPAGPGLLTLYDREARILRICGVADLRQGLKAALGEPASADAVFCQIAQDPLYTQRETEALAQYIREHGLLPVGNDLGDELFDDDSAC